MHRMYENEEITVFWNSEKCRHARKCVTGSPEVFEFGRRPWIDLSRGETARIWKSVSNCPSGALQVGYNHGITVRFDEAECGSRAFDGEKEIGECTYIASPEGWVICHTGVRPEYTGKGIAKRLVYAVLQAAEQRKVPISATCSYAVKVLKE